MYRPQIVRRDRYGRYSWFRDATDPVTPLPEGSGSITAGAIGLTNTKASRLSPTTLTFNQAILNEFRFGYTSRSVDRNSSCSTRRRQESCIPGIPSNAAFKNQCRFSRSWPAAAWPSYEYQHRLQHQRHAIYDAVSFNMDAIR